MTKKSYMKTGYRQPQNRIPQQYAAGNKPQGHVYQSPVRKQHNPHGADRHANLINTSSINIMQMQPKKPDTVLPEKPKTVLPEKPETVLPEQEKTADTASGPEEASEPQEAAVEEIIREQHEFEQWRTQETERLENREQKLHKQKKQIEQERIQLDLDKRNFLHQQEFEVTRQRNEEQLLDMKRRILEDELYKLAEEKKLFEQKKSFYDKVDSYQADDALKKPASIHGAIFFAGVNSQSALRKRYKDLLKIYHPDNKCGDTDTIQEINKEYQRLSEKMKGHDAK